jgi:hypothetical protein
LAFSPLFCYLFLVIHSLEKLLKIYEIGSRSDYLSILLFLFYDQLHQQKKKQNKIFHKLNSH